MRDDGTPVTGLPGLAGRSPKAAGIPVPWSEADVLSESLQGEFLWWISHGASPAMLCQKLGISLTSFVKAATDDAGFAERLQQAQGGLSQNVAARLYRIAMEGSVPAQRFFLELHPPPEWRQVSLPGADLKELEPDELADEYRAAGIDVPAELQALVGRRHRGVES
ncbi:MAG: hypothetical protein JNG89_07830 [Planctomycetaceae bacterium]|nr:hypothetical protein [Planctomycetaceae bacterium]